MNSTHHVVFSPSGLRGEVSTNTTVLQAARELGVDLDSVCGGRGICGRCQVDPSFGHFAKWAIEADPANLSAPGAAEARYSGKRPLGRRRLGCAARVLGDLVIDVPPESQLHRPVVDKTVDVGDVVLDPPYTLHYVEEGDPTEALSAGWGIDVDRPGRELPPAPLTVVVRDGHTVAACWPGYVERITGVAVDVGSTTIAGHLIDLGSGEVLATAGSMNPQIRFGEDLMSRVSYVMMNPGGAQKLTSAVRTAINELLAALFDASGIDQDRVLDVVIVGNPIMHHLVLGIDPTPLGQAPFPLATDGAVELAASELDLSLSAASVYVPPCIAGHVGADTAAAILSEGPHRSDAVQLLVDVGTNAEIVLGNRHQLFAASSPTGPAFEGAQITHGQRATAGAIDKVRIDPETLIPKVHVIGCEVWSDHPDFPSQTSDTGITGICGSGIIEAISELVTAGVISPQGLVGARTQADEARLVAMDRTYNYVLHGDIHVTQADVRAIQLAKAALRAGIELLMEHAAINTVEDIRLAGAFGAHIDPAHAMAIGLIPTVPLRAVRAVGNAAGSGAVRALLSAAERREIEDVVGQVTKIETATEPRFQELFVAALAFDHSTAPDTQPNETRRRRTRRSRS